MSDITRNINDLIKINQRISNYTSSSRFRTVPVYCVARTGQKITFSTPEQIPVLLTMLLDKFDKSFKKADHIPSLALALAIFWLGFISIHPFENGNGRTGKEFISRKLADQGYGLNTQALDGLLLVGKVQEDLKSLEDLFIQNIKTKEIL